MVDLQRLRPGELCRLLNSTPLGEVVNARQLKRHREQAGQRIGDSRHVNLLRYIAWLIHLRHTSRPAAEKEAPPTTCLAEAAQGAAALACTWKQPAGHGQRLTSKQEELIAALLTEPTYAAAAAKAGVGQRTLYRWLQLPSFQAAYQRARRDLAHSAVGRLQTTIGQAVETLLAVAQHGRRDSDRVRAACALLEHAWRGRNAVDSLHGQAESGATTPMATGDVVQLLAGRLRQLEAADLSHGEKSRLMALLADSFLRAFHLHHLDQRLEALEAVLRDRKENQ